MTGIRRLVLAEAILFLLILLAGSTVVVTQARYRQQRRAADLARVARPVLQVVRQTSLTDLGELQPGSSADFDFSVANHGTVEGVSEVALAYTIGIAVQGTAPLPWVLTLFWIDGQDKAHACEALPNGLYPALAPLGTTARSQRYRIRVHLPADAPLMDVARTDQVLVTVSASQLDQ